ncbi:hypothetical protein AZI86_07200 [Bdellovibrio bacteriovorus]|uniref:Uncharacterized protein n=1 Tax=Bdellovibrio bacteriovorus TaxID=959 RepID=A0A150WR78_BDEBC|nr:hypothetical protein [Bdellovibrio bacteriovorus]KYG66817.1 hypothetical protein AZI86_07200 [Bdellovibrio bacteriovorus]
MEGKEFSKAFFTKGIKSGKLALALLTSDDLTEHKEASLREFFHCFELLLKSQIATHSPYLLLANTADLSGGWGEKKSFDDISTKPASELPKLLYVLEAANPKFEFLKENFDVIEAMRKERNKSEHGSVHFTDAYVALVIAPFFHKVLSRLIDAIDPRGYEFYFDAAARIEVLDQCEKPETLLADPNRFIPIVRPCPQCLHHFAFLSKDGKNVHCLICDEDVIVDSPTKYGVCPTCDRHTLILNDFVRCLGECLIDFPATTPLAHDQSCSCNSDEISDLKEYSGSQEGLCLQCLKVLDFWKCDFCAEYWTSPSVKPPEEISDKNLCENCESHVVGIYAYPP